MATFYLDYEGGNDANDGTSFANRWKTITAGATAARIAPGDVIRVMKSPDPTSLGMTATWTKQSATVTLNSALNALITDCDTAWTASANVTATASTTRRSGTNSASLAIAAGFTTGKVAYFDLGSNQNYSAYQGITFWMQVTGTTLAAGVLTIDLCSDALGATPVNTCAIPAISQTGQWIPIYIDKGVALGNAIRSISVNAISDPGTITLLIDNISTTKAAGNDCLTLKSFIGKNTVDESWWGLRVINGATLTLDSYNLMDAASASGWKGYWGTTETVTTYQRKGIDTDLVANSTTNAQTVQDAGTLAGGYITFSGGWDRTNMTVQDGTTLFTGQSGVGRGIYTNAKNYIKFEKIDTARYSIGIICDGSYTWFAGTQRHHNCGTGIYVNGVGSGTDDGDYCIVDDVIVNATGSHGFDGVSMYRLKLTKLRVMSCGYSGVVQGVTMYASGPMDIGEVYSYNNFWWGINHSGIIMGGKIVKWHAESNGSGQITGSGNGMVDTEVDDIVIVDQQGASGHGWGINGDYRNTFVKRLTCTNIGSGAQGVWFTGQGIGVELRIGLYTASGAGTAIRMSSPGGINVINKTNITATTPISFDSGGTSMGHIRIQDYNSTGETRIYYNMGVHRVECFSVADSDRHTLSGIAWKISPLTATYVHSKNPFRFPVGKFYCKANQLVTATLWVKRSNTGLTVKFVAPGGRLNGMGDADISVTAAGSASVYEQLSISFTPTEAGVAEFYVHVYGGTTYSVWVDDLAISQ